MRQLLVLDDSIVKIGRDVDNEIFFDLLVFGRLIAYASWDKNINPLISKGV